MASGVFSLDTLKFLSKNEVWMTLPEIIGQKTDIRIFAIDDNRMRAIAEKPILIWQGKNQRIHISREHGTQKHRANRLSSACAGPSA